MSNEKTGPVQGFLNVLLFIPAAIYMILRKTGKYLTNKAYSGNWVRGIFVGLVGVGVSGALAYFAANYLSFVLGWWPLFWFPSAVVAFVLGMTHVWPAVYYYGIRHVWNLGERFLKAMQKFAKDSFKPFAAGALSLVRKLPGSDALWNLADGKSVNADGTPKVKKEWGLRLLQVALVVAALGASAYIGYLVFQLSAGVLPIPQLAFLHLQELVAGVLGFTALYVSAVTLFTFTDEGDEAVAAAAYSGVGAWALVYKTALIALPAAYAPVAVAALFLAGVAYIFPATVAILQGGLVERILKAWGELLDSVYAREDNKEFRLFYHHVMNIVLSVVAGFIFHSVMQVFTMPALLSLAASVIVAGYVYVEEGRDYVGKSSGNTLIGLAVSALSGAYAYYSVLPAHFAVSTAALVAMSVMVSVVVGLVVYPFAYLLFRALTSWAAPALGPVLASIHGGVNKAFSKVREGVKWVQRKAFDDRTPFGGMFGHLLNLAVVAGAVWQGLPLLAPYLAGHFWLTVIGTGFLSLNLFVLLSRVFSRYGAETLAVASFFVTLVGTGHVVLAATGSWLAVFVVAFSLAGFVGGFLAPLVYIALELPSRFLLTPWLAPVLNGVFDAIWKTYAAIWKAIGEQFAWLTGILAVVFRPVIVAAQAAWASVQRILDRFGGK